MKPIDDPKNWLPLKEVAYLLRVSRYTVTRLCKELNPDTRQTYLRGWRANHSNNIARPRNRTSSIGPSSRKPGFATAAGESKSGRAKKVGADVPAAFFPRLFDLK